MKATSAGKLENIGKFRHTQSFKRILRNLKKYIHQYTVTNSKLKWSVRETRKFRTMGSNIRNGQFQNMSKIEKLHQQCNEENVV